MSEQVEKTFVKEVEVTEDVTRELYAILIQKNGYVCMEIIWIDGDSKVVNREWYRENAAVIGVDSPEVVDTYYNLIKAKCWSIVDAIDAMPETTEEERLAKAQKKGRAFSYHLG